MTDNMAPAGWYPDGSGQDRWWDGTQWTDHFRSAGLSSADSPKRAAATAIQGPLEASTTADAGSAVAGQTAQAWYAKRWVIGVIALFVGIWMGSLGSSGSSDPKKSDQYQSLSATYSDARTDLSSLKSDLADEQAKEKVLKSQLSDAKAAEKKAKAAQAQPVAAAPTKAASKTGGTSAAPTTHACTKTSSGSCIQGGEFCRQALYGQSGWNASGTRYTCTGDHTHPHWE